MDENGFVCSLDVGQSLERDGGEGLGVDRIQNRIDNIVQGSIVTVGYW